MPEREGLRTWHRQVSGLCIIGRRRFAWEGLLSRRDAWTAVELGHFILRVDLIYLGVLELQVRGGVRVGLLLSLSRPRARFLVPLLGLLRIFLSHRLLGLLSVELRGVHAITSARNARLKRVFCASYFMLSLRSFINHLLIIIKHGELITYVNNMMLNTQKERKRSTFTCHAIFCSMIRARGSSIAREGDIILFLQGRCGESLESVCELAVEAHGLSGGFQALCGADIAGLQALGLVSVEGGCAKGVEAFVEAADEHGSLEFLDVHLFLCVHYSFYYNYKNSPSLQAR